MVSNFLYQQFVSVSFLFYLMWVKFAVQVGYHDNKHKGDNADDKDNDEDDFEFMMMMMMIKMMKIRKLIIMTLFIIRYN